MYKFYTEVISIKVSPEQREWLENKAIEHTRLLGKEVCQTMILRAMIQKQMDLDNEKRKIWNDQLQIPGTL